ncbi:MAG: peptidoglycan DD-metalloendopeptidase family protein [Pseudomonadota bacterium]
MFFKSPPIFALLLVCGASGTVFANELTRSEAELDALKGSIKALNKQLDQERKEEQSISADLDRIEIEMASLAKTIVKGERTLDSLQSEQKRLNERNVELQSSSLKARQSLAELIKSSFLLGREGGLKLVLNQGNPAESGRQLAIYRYLMEARDDQLTDIQDELSALKQLHAELSENRSRIQNENNSLKEQRESLADREKSRQRALSKVIESIEEGESQAKLYARKEKNLVKLLQKLKRRKSEADRAATSLTQIRSGDEKQTVAETGSPTPAPKKAVKNEPVLLSGFKKNRGRLQLPVRGKIIARFGQKKPESGLRWEGLMFRSESKRQVEAIYPGQVVYADWFHGYGQLLVLDHGEGYMSLYGHNDRLHTEIGDVVAAGQVVAQAGTSGGLRNPGLYFEIRRNGEPDDPLEWCRI